MWLLCAVGLAIVALCFDYGTRVAMLARWLAGALGAGVVMFAWDGGGLYLTNHYHMMPAR